MENPEKNQPPNCEFSMSLRRWDNLQRRALEEIKKAEKKIKDAEIEAARAKAEKEATKKNDS